MFAQARGSQVKRLKNLVNKGVSLRIMDALDSQLANEANKK